MTPAEYWQEAAETALDEMGRFDLVQSMTQEQRVELGIALSGSHECFGMAFHSPPPSDRIADIEREYKTRIAKIEVDAERYRHTAERTMARVLHQYPDARVSITENGEVLRHGGRIERIA